MAAIEILIVDDLPENLRILQEILHSEGYIVRAFKDGNFAIQSILLQKPDMILLDVMMPSINGFEVCTKLKENSSTKDIPILFLSALDDVENKSKAFAMGAVDYITKPFQSWEVSARVKTHLELNAIRKKLQNQNNLLLANLKQAHKVQNMMLPRAPKLEGLDIQVKYKAVETLGGDYYDFIYEGNSLGVLIADVAGHGLPAALIVSMLKVSFWSLKKSFAEPKKMLENLNKILIENIDTNFATVIYFSINLDSLQLKVSNGGHPEMYVIRKSGDVLRLKPRGNILGVIPNPSYDMNEIQLQKEDRIVVYTDGLIEATNSSKEFYGHERFVDFISESRDLSAREFLDKFWNHLMEWVGDIQNIDDDIAIVVIDVLKS
jgi:serine phosphatase RsbU (regulator of sigma subunit)